MHEKLKAVVQNIVPLEDSEWRHIRESFAIKEVPSKHVLTGLGEVAHEVYFVVKGILRLFCINPKHEEVTVFLFKEYLFASSFESFLTGNQSNQVLETLEDCQLLCISKEKLDYLYNTVPKMHIITRIVSEQRFINSQRIFSSHIMLTPEERYLQFEQLHGDLLLRVPQHIIASFLGVTPVSLSRIRKRISQK